jgi:hypothetical protein
MRRFISFGLVTLVALIACQKTSSTPLTTKCTTDADCVWETKSRGDCCVNPCGNPARPVHKDESQSIQKYNDDYCKSHQAQCPQAGACSQPPAKTPVTKPKCSAGACVAS